MIIKGKKIDVKTKKQNYPPAPHHTYNIFAFNTRQKCDYYCFVVVLSDLTKAWIVGWKDKENSSKKLDSEKKVRLMIITQMEHGHLKVIVIV
jgi:hypothetical protein